MNKYIQIPKMLCHVTRPDSVVMEVEVDAKANGEDCLNKVGEPESVLTAFSSSFSFLTCYMNVQCFQEKCLRSKQ